MCPRPDREDALLGCSRSLGWAWIADSRYQPYLFDREFRQQALEPYALGALQNLAPLGSATSISFAVPTGRCCSGLKRSAWSAAAHLPPAAMAATSAAKSALSSPFSIPSPTWTLSRPLTCSGPTADAQQRTHAQHQHPISTVW